MQNGSDVRGGAVEGVANETVNLTAEAVNRITGGFASPPAMFMSTIFDETKADGSVMLTASHLSFNRNSMKIFVNNPEDKTAMASIKKAVLENKADLGLIFDTDVD